MTYAPSTLQNLDSYLTSRDVPVLGIVGDRAHRGGYHVGKDRIYGPNGYGSRDYSVQTARDKAGLSNAAAAIDIGRHLGIIELGVHLRGKPDIRELIAERGDGTHIWRWVDGRTTGKPDSQELPHHLHVSYFRDSEQRDKTAPYRAFYDSTGDDVSITYRTAPELPTGRLSLRAQDGIHFLRLRDGKLIEVTDRAAFGVKEPVLPVRLDEPIVKGKPKTDEWCLGYIVGEDAAFVLSRNVVIESPQYVKAVEP